MVRWPALLLASACSSVPAKTIFGPPLEIAVGSFPIDVAVADLDGDGFLDLVSADARARALSVLRGRGDGTFAAGGVLPLAAEPHLVVAGDLDADGDVDLVASAHDDPSVHVWLGDGQGGFEPRPPAAAHEGTRGHNHGLALGDLDGDGRLDAVTANQDLGSISVLLGDGLGLAPGSQVAVGAAPTAARSAISTATAGSRSWCRWSRTARWSSCAATGARQIATPPCPGPTPWPSWISISTGGPTCWPRTTTPTT